MSKTAKLQKLITGKKLSVTAIRNRLGITNVSAFIYDLRRNGVNVVTTATSRGETAYTI